jgi:hypothetical protein
VFWPSANLGVVGALQLAGSLIAALAWRPTGAGVMRRARVAAAALVAAGAALAVIRVPVEHRAAELATLAITLVAAAALTTVRLALLELAHRSVDERSSVRAFTLLDVVASTSLQMGLLAGGLLVTASSSVSEWMVDPYRIYVVVCTALAFVAIGTLSDATSPRSHEVSAP